MRIPHAEQATVAERKITGYLLSPTHPGGESKARYFSMHGFSLSMWSELADALRRHAVDNDVKETEQTPRGVSFTVEGSLFAPSGVALLIRSVWFQDIGERAPHLVTAYPLKKGASA